MPCPALAGGVPGPALHAASGHARHCFVDSPWLLARWMTSCSPITSKLLALCRSYLALPAATPCCVSSTWCLGRGPVAWGASHCPPSWHVFIDCVDVHSWTEPSHARTSPASAVAMTGGAILQIRRGDSTVLQLVLPVALLGSRSSNLPHRAAVLTSLCLNFKMPRHRVHKT